ncbi:MAG TPA: hypothetical protein VF772_00790, partial [Terriglobales bacterium]
HVLPPEHSRRQLTTSLKAVWRCCRSEWFTGNSDITRLGKSFAWACGPPIDMKIKSSKNVYDQGAWNGKDRGNSG